MIALPHFRTGVPHARRGFVFLASILALGFLASATSVALLFLGGLLISSTNRERQWIQAMANARSCAEYAMYWLGTDPETRGQGYGSATPSQVPWLEERCTIQKFGDLDPAPFDQANALTNRTICTSGTAGNITRRLEIQIDSIGWNGTYPTAVISIWREVYSASPSLCPQ